MINFQLIRDRKEFSQFDKSICKNSAANIILMVRNSKLSHYIKFKVRTSTIMTPIEHYTGNPY